MNKAEIALSNYLAKKIDECGKTNAEIAKDIGTTDPSFISAMKTCREFVPKDRVNRLARAIGGSPSKLNKLVEDVQKAYDKAKRMRATKAAKAKTAVIRQPKAVTEEPVVFIERPVWFPISHVTPPSDKPHVRYNAKTKQVEPFLAARHAPHPDYTKWAYWPLPEAPKD